MNKRISLGIWLLMMLMVSFSSTVPALAAADDWTQKSPDQSPSARKNHAMAYIGGTDQVLLFGGEVGSQQNSSETWVYDLSDDTWTLKDPASAPSARHSHAMAYIGGDQVLLFGGHGQGDDTWVYDLSDNNWTQKSPASAPSARLAPAMAYIGGDQALLFGGYNENGFNGETWVYDLSENTWTQKSLASAPSARAYHAMAYIGTDQVLLFGGWLNYREDDTWVYDLSDNTWTDKSPTTHPSARNTHRMAYMGSDQVLLFGGNDGTRDDETWVYELSDNNWTQKSPASAPSARHSHAMAYIGGDQVLLFGGDVASRDDETWVYGVPTDTTPPVVTNVLANPNPAAVNTAITVSANVDDSNTGNSNIADAEYSLDGGDWTDMAPSDSSFDSPTEDVGATLSAFSEAGVHEVCVRGTDAAGKTSSGEDCALLAVYDPAGGFVTGGGWIWSEAGWCQLDEVCAGAEGKANFGFVSKYKKGADKPTGNTEFQFKAGDLNFHSDSYDWLVVAGHDKAKYKGSGTINGGGNYGFMLTAKDSSPDTFRIKIWDKDAGDGVVYDNKMSTGDDSYDGTALGGGNIKVHKAK